MNRPSHIIVHHSLTEDTGTVSWAAIRKYHTEFLGWNDIGYHFGIEMVFMEGMRFEVLMGRMPYEDGAHCKDKNMNKKSLGVCMVGNFDFQEPPRAQWALGVKLCYWLSKVYRIPVEKIHGHREFSDKTCPGIFFDMDKFRRDVLMMKGETP